MYLLYRTHRRVTHSSARSCTQTHWGHFPRHCCCWAPKPSPKPLVGHHQGWLASPWERCVSFARCHRSPADTSRRSCWSSNTSFSMQTDPGKLWGEEQPWQLFFPSALGVYTCVPLRDKKEKLYFHTEEHELINTNERTIKNNEQKSTA